MSNAKTAHSLPSKFDLPPGATLLTSGGPYRVVDDFMVPAGRGDLVARAAMFAGTAQGSVAGQVYVVACDQSRVILEPHGRAGDPILTIALVADHAELESHGAEVICYGGHVISRKNTVIQGPAGSPIIDAYDNSIVIVSEDFTPYVRLHGGARIVERHRVRRNSGRAIAGHFALRAVNAAAA